MTALAVVGAWYIVYPHGQQPLPSRMSTENTQTEHLNTEGEVPESGDLCGGTGGNGQIITIGDRSITLQRNDAREQIVHFTDSTVINTLQGPAPISDLDIGDRLTLVGGPNADGSFTADAVFVCSVSKQ